VIANAPDRFSSRQAAVQAAENFRANAAAWDYHVARDDAGAWHWRVLAANGRTVAVSAEGFASETGARRAARQVSVSAATADLVTP
jgi:uncharacterized protein YegP (UPF0339 family)